MTNELTKEQKIEKVLAKFAMKDGAFLSTWNEKTGEYTVSFEGDDLLKELSSLLTPSVDVEKESLTRLAIEKGLVGVDKSINDWQEGFKRGYDEGLENGKSQQPHPHQSIDRGELKDRIKKELREYSVWLSNTYKTQPNLHKVVEQYIELYVDKDGDFCKICNRPTNKLQNDGICGDCL